MAFSVQSVDPRDSYSLEACVVIAGRGAGPEEERT